MAVTFSNIVVFPSGLLRVPLARIFLFFLLIFRCFFFYILPVYLGAPYAFNDICQLLIYI
jgi:hypothetical protein